MDSTRPPVASAATRKIVHIDMDAFYASVEQRDNPELRGRPVVVAWRGARSVVCAASYEARTFGIRSAMPAMRAERLCPQAVFVPPDFVRYRQVSRQVREIFRRHTDLIEPLSLDEAYLDVTVDQLGLGSATAVAKAIRASIHAETALTASAGVAPNKFLAKIASDWRKPDGLFVIRPHEVEAFLAPLPVSRLPGVGKVMTEKLAKLGVESVAHLRELERLDLERRFGRWGGRLFELAWGIDHHAVESDRPVQSISTEDTLPEDLPLSALAPMIERLAHKAWADVTKETRIGRTVVLKLKTSDFKVLTRSLTPAKPPTSAAELAAIALGLTARVESAEVAAAGIRRYRLVGVGVSHFVDGDRAAVEGVSQLSLFSGERGALHAQHPQAQEQGGEAHCGGVDEKGREPDRINDQS